MKKLLYLSFLLLSLIISCTKSDLPPVGKGNFIELSLTSNVSSVTINTATISTTSINEFRTKSFYDVTTTISTTYY